MEEVRLQLTEEMTRRHTRQQLQRFGFYEEHRDTVRRAVSILLDVEDIVLWLEHPSKEISEEKIKKMGMDEATVWCRRLIAEFRENFTSLFAREPTDDETNVYVNLWMLGICVRVESAMPFSAWKPKSIRPTSDGGLNEEDAIATASAAQPAEAPVSPAV